LCTSSVMMVRVRLHHALTVLVELRLAQPGLRIGKGFGPIAGPLSVNLNGRPVETGGAEQRQRWIALVQGDFELQGTCSYRCWVKSQSCNATAARRSWRREVEAHPPQAVSDLPIG